MESRKTLERFFNSKMDDIDYVNKYEENKTFFNDIFASGRKEDLEFAVPIAIYNYAAPLNRLGYYSKSLKALIKIESALRKLQSVSKRYELLNESFTFLKGACLGNLKKYRKSNVEFKKILKI